MLKRINVEVKTKKYKNRKPVDKNKSTSTEAMLEVQRFNWEGHRRKVCFKVAGKVKDMFLIIRELKSL